MSVRTERVASVIKAEVGNYLQRTFRLEEVGLLTVTEVRVTPDLRVAKIFVSVFGDQLKKDATMALLEQHRPDIRSVVGQAVRLRFTPDVVLALDTTMDNAMNLERIFKKIHEEEKNRGRKDDPDDAT